MNPKPTAEQARAEVIAVAIEIARLEQWDKINPGQVNYDFAYENLTMAILTYLPHITILAKKDVK